MHNSPPSFVGLGLHGARLPPSSRECHQLYCPDQRALSLSLCARPFARPYYSWLQSNGPLPCPSTTWCPSLIPALTTLPLPFTYTPLHAVNTPPAARYTPEAASRQPARLLPVSRGTRQPAGGLGPCWHPVRRAYMMPRAPALAMLRSYHHENTRSH